jgi:hypothetical protein
MPTAFSAAIGKVVLGTHQAEEFARIIVESAVDATIRAISKEYGLDPERVKRDHAEVIVRSHAMCDDGKCTKITTRGNVCGHPIILGERCPKHYIAPKKPRLTRGIADAMVDTPDVDAAWVARILAKGNRPST